MSDMLRLSLCMSGKCLENVSKVIHDDESGGQRLDGVGVMWISSQLAQLYVKTVSSTSTH